MTYIGALLSLPFVTAMVDLADLKWCSLVMITMILS